MADALDGVLARSQALGFLGPGPVAEQRRHAEAYVGALGDLPLAGTALDLGSGGGIPGLVLAQVVPQLRWTLLDGMVRRTRFLEAAVVELGLAGRVTVLTARAEEVGRGPLRGTFDLVVARSFGSPAVTAECAAPLLRPGGQLVVSEPPASTGERWPPTGVAELGLVVEDLRTGPPGFVRLRQVMEAPSSVPRRTGVPAKRPRW